MGYYTYYDKKKKERFTVTMTISEMSEFEKDNPHLERVYENLNIIDPVGAGISKPPTDFTKHVLGKIKHKNPKNNIGKGRWDVPKEI